MVRILVVDDNPDIIFTVKKGLETLEKGYEVDGAENGEQAVQKLQENKPDLILCDIMMPKMEGWDVVAKIRQTEGWSTIPIIFLTAKSDDVSKSMAKFGVDDYIVKPAEIEDLDARIQSKLGQ